MKKNVIQLAMWLLRLHEWGDQQLIQEKLPTRDAMGNKTGWEYDKVLFYGSNHRERYIGLGMYHTQYYNKPEWKEAYNWLCENGFLERLESHENQFKLLQPDISDLIKDDTGVPSVPVYLQDDYKAYINSSEWRKKASERLNMDGCKCQDCGKEATAVHHLNYDNLFNENVETDLISLCDECHKRRHNRE